GLTIDNSTAENYTTIFSISESPKDGKVIWVGTDDGNLQLTRDSGKTWANVVANVPELPKGTWVSCVSASPFDAATVFVTFDGHRTGDMKTYAYVSRDFGATWQALAATGVEGYAHVLRQDLQDPQLLFLGTEMGLYISIDSGHEWARFTGNLPKVAVNDLAIHPREHDLILATHGRGMYIIDDISTFRQLSSEVVNSDVKLLDTRPTVMPTFGQAQEFGGDDEFVGTNPPEAVAITYYLKKRQIFGEVKVEVYDSAGKLLSTIQAGKRKGLNRVYWPMRLPPPKLPAATNLAPAAIGPRVLEGTYTVKLIRGKETYTQQVQLVADPRSPHSAEDRQAEQKLSLRLYGMIEDLTYMVEAATGVRDQARARAKEARPGDKTVKSLEDLAKRFEDFRGSLVSTSDAGWLSGDEKLREHLAAVYAGVTFYEGRPTQTQIDRTEALAGELTAAGQRFDGLVSKDLAALNQALTKQGGKPIAAKTRAEWDAENKK
ncbi:MAG TPA: glycosyl hydrolase, partial [Thermoanaerobaculia bacterium]|nr:glycosyl hydrolase [Thermoanaerobaculia bacterium]